MNIIFDCSISLSKKLRTMLASGGSIVLTASDIEDGKGNGTLRVESGADLLLVRGNASQLFGNETSIMLTLSDVHTDATPSDLPVSTIFSTVPDTNVKEPVVEKMATVIADHRTVASMESQQTPIEFKEVDNPSCQAYIFTMKQLLDAVEAAKHKTTDIDPHSIADPRKRAIAMEQKEQMEAIDSPAFIVNEKIAMIAVNDLDITLPMNCPFDLSRISAKRIAQSRDLKSMHNQGYIKFIEPKEFDKYKIKVEEIENSKIGSLEVYDNHEQAAYAMTDEVKRRATYEGRGHFTGEVDVSEETMDALTDEEQMMKQLEQTRNEPLPEATPPTAKKTSHGTSHRARQSSGATTLSGTFKKSSMKAITPTDR